MRLATPVFVAVMLLHAGLGPAAQALRDEPGPVEQRANPITPENPIPRRTLGVTPVYPPEAAAIDATGRVAVRVTLDELGRVAETRRFKTPQLVFPGAPATAEALRAAADALVLAAADAIRQWQYESPVTPPISFSVTIAFTPSGEATLVSQDGSPSADRPRALVPPPSPLDQTPLDAAWADGAVRVGGDIRPPIKLKNVAPVYPPEARAERVQGVVILDARIGPDGRVTDVRVLRSVAGLDDAAIEAVRQWEFTPTVVDGRAVPVVITATVNFSM